MKKIFVIVLLAQSLAFAQSVDNGTGDVGSVGGDAVEISLGQQAAALGQIADQNLAGDDATILLRNVIAGQAYESRVSLMSTSCQRDPDGNGLQAICKVEIGVDDLQDDDNGWGTVMQLEYRINIRSGGVSSATLSLVAG